MAGVAAGRVRWPSDSSTKRLCWAGGALCRYAHLISRQQERRDAIAATSATFMPHTSAFTPQKLRSPAFKKPEVIKWQENMPVNDANFIGIIVRDMQIQYLRSGKIVANSSIKVRRNMLNHSWFYLEFWDDLAEVAAAHLKIGDRICVSGSVWPERVMTSDGLEKTFAKVVVKDLKFVPQRDSGYEESVQNFKLKLDELWTNLFDNRADWVDTRRTKISEHGPDFKHKFLDKALWLDNKHTPGWVKERLMKEGSL